jgi:hypothetical protein
MRTLAAFALAGCAPASLVSSDGGHNDPPRVLEVSIMTEAVSPTDPIEITFSEAIAAASVVDQSIVVAAGEIDAPFRADLDTPPLSASRAERVLAARVVAEGVLVILEPTVPMLPETVYTLAVSRALRDADGRSMDEGYAFRFVTAAPDGGAPVLEMVAPASGAAGIPTNLARVLVRFSESVAGVDATSLQLFGGDRGVESDVSSAESWCAGCYEIQPRGPLGPGLLHEVRTTAAVRDAEGNPPFPAEPPSFSTGAGPDGTPPLLWLPDVRVSGGCLLARWLSDEPATSEVLGAFDGRLVAVHEAAALLSTPGTISFHVESADAADNRASLGPLEATFVPTPTLVITEVMANPVGAEPAQEWVEIANLGGEDVSLAGLLLADEGGDDPFPDVTLPVGAVGLVVGEAYDPLEGSDPPPGPGAILLRVPGSLGQSGLRNSGERVEVRDAFGTVWSSYGGYVDTASPAGQSAVRTDLLGCDRPEAWTASATAASTPGAL